MRLFQKKPYDRWLFVGLGNPGEKYAGNRHNVGFLAADRIASDHGFPAYRSKFEGEFSEGTLGGARVVLLKPMTYMNNSGQSVAKSAKFFKIPPEKIVVFHDDLDLVAGKLKTKQGGGAAGHNGLKSIDAHLGTPDYWRVRLGIGHPGDKDKVHGYVLSDFSKTEQKWLEPWLEAISKYAPLLAEGKTGDFMSKVAQEGDKNGI